jgi:hypothetical protein
MFSIRNRSSAALALILVLTAALIVATAPAAAKSKKVTERYEAHASSLSAGRATLMQIGIFGYTTPKDRTELIKTFQDGGAKAAYKHLNKMDEMGFVKAPNSMGYQMRYAYKFQQDGKDTIVMATDRPIAMGEVMQDSWTADDNISLVFLQVDSETGEGTGEMIVGAGLKLDAKTGQLSIESVATNPIKFASVKRLEVKHKGD